MNFQRKTIFNAAIIISLYYFFVCVGSNVFAKSQKNEEKKEGANLNMTVSTTLKNILKKDPSDPTYVHEDEFIKVIIALTDEGGEAYDIPPRTGTNFNDADDGRQDIYYNDDKEILERIDIESKARRERRQAVLQELAKRNGWEHHPAIIAALNEDSGIFSVIIPIKKGKILDFIQRNRDIIDGVELYVEPHDE